MGKTVLLTPLFQQPASCLFVLQLKDAAGEWFRDIVRAAVGSLDKASGVRGVSREKGRPLGNGLLAAWGMKTRWIGLKSGCLSLR